MSFISVKNNARNRFNENLQFLNFISTLEPSNPRDAVSLEVNIMKGLFYVHLYSSLESTISALTEQTIIQIDSKAISLKHYNDTFNTIALTNKLKSFKSCGHKNFFSKAYEIFDESTKSINQPLNETTFSGSLQNVWFKTIEEISKCFGIKGLIVDPRIKTTIDEIVEKRNAVAHGREKASDIGTRFRTDNLRTKLLEASTFAYNLIDLYDDYLVKKNYLKKGAKRLYT